MTVADSKIICVWNVWKWGSIFCVFNIQQWRKIGHCLCEFLFGHRTLGVSIQHVTMMLPASCVLLATFTSP